MSPLSSLFGKHATEPRETKTKCVQCDKELSTAKGGMTIVGRDAMQEYLNQRSLYCSVCQKTYCAQCSFAAAQRIGAGTFVCPNCGRVINMT